MKNIQQMMNLLLGVIGLTLVSAINNLGVEDIMSTESLRIKKQSGISCGYSQRIDDNPVHYSVDRYNQFLRSYLSPLIKTGEEHSKNSGEGNGCSHQPSVDALLCGSVGSNRKLQKVCTVS